MATPCLRLHAPIRGDLHRPDPGDPGLTGFVTVLTDIVGPVLLIGAAGYALGRARVVEPQPLASLAVTALVPAIAFYAVTSPARDHGVLVRMAAFIALQLALLGALAVAVALCFGWDRARRTGLLMSPLTIAVLLTLLR